jgi:hypothetical protein
MSISCLATGKAFENLVSWLSSEREETQSSLRILQKMLQEHHQYP